MRGMEPTSVLRSCTAVHCTASSPPGLPVCFSEGSLLHSLTFALAHKQHCTRFSLFFICLDTVRMKVLMRQDPVHMKSARMHNYRHRRNTLLLTLLTRLFMVVSALVLHHVEFACVACNRRRVSHPIFRASAQTLLRRLTSPSSRQLACICALKTG